MKWACLAPPHPATLTGSLSLRQLTEGENVEYFHLRVEIPIGISVGIRPTSCHSCNVLGSPKRVRLWEALTPINKSGVNPTDGRKPSPGNVVPPAGCSYQKLNNINIISMIP